MAQVAATHDVRIDLDGDELLATTEEVTEAIDDQGQRGAQLISSVRGRDSARLLSGPRAGAMGFALDNQGGDYDPGDDLAEGQACRWRMTNPTGGAVLDIFRGLTDTAEQEPGAGLQHRVRVPVRGNLSRLVGREISTALYEGQDTGALMHLALDAADYPKNAQAYVTALAPAGQWGLGETSGDAIDLSGNGNDGTVAYAAGQRGETAIDDEGDGALTFYEGTVNLCTNPSFETNTTGWTVGAGAGLARQTDNVAFGSYGGRITPSAGTSAHWIYMALAGVVTAGDVVTYSVYVKANGATWVVLSDETTAPVQRVWFNLSTGAVGTQTNGTGTITAMPSLGAGWYRITATFTVRAAQTGLTSALYPTSGDAAGPDASLAGTEIVDLDGFQVEVKPAATDYADGTLGTGYSWSGSAHASTSTRVATKVTVADDAAIQNVFDAGGGLGLLANITSDGEGDDGTLASKGWTLKTTDESAGFCRLQFEVPFSTTAGIWRTDRDVPIATNLQVDLTYDADDVANNPTVRVTDLSTAARTSYTVGSGLTETQTPVGTRTTDAGTDLVWGNVPGGTETFDGILDEPFLDASTTTATELTGWVSRVLTARRRIDTGSTTLSYRWWTREDAWGAVLRLLNCEGPGAVVYEAGDGAFVFKSRDAYLTESRSTTAQATFRTAAGGAEPLASGWRYDPGSRDKIRTATARVSRRSAKASDVVWSLGTTVTLAVGQSVTYDASFADGAPVTAAVTPSSAGGDFTVTAGSLSSVALDRTSGGAISITLTAGASGATVTGLRLRAQLVSEDGATVVTDQLGLTATDQQSYVLPVYEELDVEDAQNFVDAIVGFYKEGRPRATLTVEANVDAARMTQALTREIHDRIEVIDGMTGLQDDFFVHQIRQDVYSPNRLVTTFELELATSVAGFRTGISLLDTGPDQVWF